MRKHNAVLVGAFAALASLLLLAPAVAAFGVGIDTGPGLDDLKNSGGSAAYAQTWVGKWTLKSGWSGFESTLKKARDNGATPVVLFYYWGDSISVDAVKYGKDGMSRAQWDQMAKDLATKGNAVMGGKPWIIVLEPEFNKNGISSFEDFDGYLANQASTIKSLAPSAKIAIGFGHWGGWDIFDRAMGKADYSGFQLMRASTRDTVAQAEGMAAQAVDVAGKLKSRWGKPVILFDLAVASYGGWEGTQEKAIRNFAVKRGELDAAGVFAVVYRYGRDNCYSSGYFGAAECYWGLQKGDGADKPAWDDFVALAKGGSAPPPSTPGAPSGGGTFTATFSGVKVEEWWVQTSITASKTVSKVEARINGGAWTAIDKQSWGGWAKSLHVLSGQSVEFRATASDGSTAVSQAYARGGSAAPPTGGSAFAATFEGVKVQEWWVQTSVKANQGVTKVEARINGGAWVALDKQSWGGWAKSLHVLAGQKVEFRATASDGSTAVSSAYAR